MGRSEDPAIAKVFVMAARGMDLHAAWLRCGSPTSWGNVQRRHKIMELLTDPEETVEVVDGQLSGEMPVNFGVLYDDADADESGSVHQLLTLDDYATSAQAEDGAWVLLADGGKKGSMKKGKQKSSKGAKGLPDVAAMSAAELEALRALLDSY